MSFQSSKHIYGISYKYNKQLSHIYGMAYKFNDTLPLNQVKQLRVRKNERDV